MDIRPLEREEICRLIPLAEQFYAEGKLPGRLVPEKFISTWETLFDQECGYILGMFEGTELVGTLGAMTYPDIYDGDLIATEMFWFVNEQHRGRGLQLFNEFEKWAAEIGAVRIVMIHLKNLSPDVLHKLYVKRGYNEIETHFIKDL